ncbi:MAG: 6-phospho-3-hexuloisomerase [Candidatus Caldatribacteriaceae bacterium]
MGFLQSLEIIFKETQELLSTLKEEEIKNFLSLLKDYHSRRIFVWGRGRSFLILKGFAMRLMHLGYTVHVVGEVTCPSIQEGDLFLCASGSGTTSSVLLFAEKAKKMAAKTVGIVGRPNTPLHDVLDEVVTFHPEIISPSSQLTTQGGGTRFEHSLFLFLDACILKMIASREEESYRLMMRLHANLE